MGRLLSIIVILFTTIVIFIFSIFTHLFKGILNLKNIFKNKQKGNSWQSTTGNSSHSTSETYQSTTTSSSSKSDDEEDEEGEYIDFKEIKED